MVSARCGMHLPITIRRTRAAFSTPRHRGANRQKNAVKRLASPQGVISRDRLGDPRQSKRRGIALAKTPKLARPCGPALVCVDQVHDGIALSPAPNMGHSVGIEGRVALKIRSLYAARMAVYMKPPFNWNPMPRLSDLSACACALALSPRLRKPACAAARTTGSHQTDSHSIR
jgi:hypothetical protein